MATYSAPSPMSDGDLLTLDIINAIINDILFLRDPSVYRYLRGVAQPDYTIASATYADIDGTNLNCTITTSGNPVEITFSGRLTNTTNSTFFDIFVDGVTITGDATGVGGYLLGTGQNVYIKKVVALGAGSHTFKMRWKNGGGTSTLSSAGMTQYIVRET